MASLYLFLHRHTLNFIRVREKKTENIQHCLKIPPCSAQPRGFCNKVSVFAKFYIQVYQSSNADSGEVNNFIKSDLDPAHERSCRKEFVQDGSALAKF